jgi:hypothetical protein
MQTLHITEPRYSQYRHCTSQSKDMSHITVEIIQLQLSQYTHNVDTTRPRAKIQYGTDIAHHRTKALTTLHITERKFSCKKHRISQSQGTVHTLHITGPNTRVAANIHHIAKILRLQISQCTGPRHSHCRHCTS